MYHHLFKHLTQGVKHTYNAAQTFVQSPHGQKLVKEAKIANGVRKVVTAFIKNGL